MRWLWLTRALIPHNCTYQFYTLITRSYIEDGFFSLSDLTDLEIVMDQLNTSLFPGVPSTLYAHGGFLSEHALTAPTILAETKRLISTKGANEVILVCPYAQFVAVT